MRLVASLTLVVLAGCARKSEPVGSDASATPAPSTSYSFGAPVPEGDASTAAITRAHFGDAGAEPVDTYVAELSTPGRRATLTLLRDRPPSQARPILVVSEDDGTKVLWSRERPTAGIMPPVGPMAIASGPKDRIALAVCDPPTGIVALRLIDFDGAPFADLQALTNEPQCDAIDVVYWPKRGWVIAVAHEGATRAQLVKDNGSLAWSSGLDVGVRARAGTISPPSLAIDTSDTFVLVQVAPPNGEPGAPVHALAFRYDAEGTAIWPKAVDVEAPGLKAGQRVPLVPQHPGVRLEISGRSVTLKPSGDIAR